MYQSATIALLVLTGSCPLPAAPVAPVSESSAKLYFPTTVGTKWVYDRNGKEETETITAVEKKAGAYIVTVEGIDYLKGTIKNEFVVSRDSLTQTKHISWVGHPPALLLKLSGKDGETWQTELGGWSNGKNTVKRCGSDTIEVPAGKYATTRVETTFFHPTGLIRAQYWYAPGVGLVKETYGDSVRKLKSFTPGKK